MATVGRIGDKIDQGSGPLALVPRSSSVSAHKQSIVRGVVPVHAFTRRAKDVKVGFSPERDGIPAPTGVGGLDQPE